MVYTYKHKKNLWYDLENPTHEEVRELAEKYNIDLITANELLSPTIRPRVDVFSNYIYLILHFPVAHSLEDKSNNVEKIQEVDFIIGKNFIITTRYSTVDALLEFSKAFEVESILDKSNMTDHAGFIFYYMIQYLYRSLMNRLENINDLMSDIERNIFEGKEKEMVREISKINRLLLNYKEATNLHLEILESFQHAGSNIFGEKFSYYLNGILGEYKKVRRTMMSEKEYLDELRETNDSLLTTKQNEIMKVLTIIAFITFPLNLIAAIFGMNTVNMPIVGHNYDFMIVLALMFILTSSIFVYFRYKKWL